MRYGIIVLIPMLWLTACSAARSSVSPDVVEYSIEVQKQAARELLTCECPTILELLKDYKVMRDQARLEGLAHK